MGGLVAGEVEQPNFTGSPAAALVGEQFLFGVFALELAADRDDELAQTQIEKLLASLKAETSVGASEQ
jgi:hypothetical protein